MGREWQHGLDAKTGVSTVTHKEEGREKHENVRIGSLFLNRMKTTCITK